MTAEKFFITSLLISSSVITIFVTFFRGIRAWEDGHLRRAFYCACILAFSCAVLATTVYLLKGMT